MLISEITFTIESTPSLEVEFGADPTLDFAVDGFAVVYQALPEYEGPMTVTPSAEEQVLDTDTKSVYGNIVIGPIPQNYGLITWNGSVLTVS